MTPTLLALRAFFVGSIFAFASITEDYLTNDPLVDWDIRFATWLHSHASDRLVTFFKVVTWAGNSLFLIVVVGALGLTAALTAAGAASWWMLPVAVAGVLGASVLRASRL